MKAIIAKGSELNALVRQAFKFFMIGVLAIIPAFIIIKIILFMKDLVIRTFILFYGYSGSYVYTVLALLISFVVFASIGYSTVKYGRSFVTAGFDFVIERIPFLNSVYRVSKKIVNMLSGHEALEPREVVYIEYPKEGLWVPAYVTNKKDDMYILFVPTSPNPTSGFTVITHKTRVVKSDMNIEQATSFVISVGVDYFREEEALNLRP